ncbi:hypothetical protein ABC977_03005, partial [Thioalkalicoccus limnaeus]
DKLDRRYEAFTAIAAAWILLAYCRHHLAQDAEGWLSSWSWSTIRFRMNWRGYEKFAMVGK